MSNKIIISVVAVIAIAGLVLVFKSQAPKTLAPAPVAVENANKEAVVQPPIAVPQTNVDVAKLPERFPSDVPLEAGAEVTSNYTAVNAKGLYQSTREFVSKKTLAENFALYQSALKQAGWTITQSIDDAAQKVILATKSGSSLTIRIYTVGSDVKVLIANESQP